MSLPKEGVAVECPRSAAGLTIRARLSLWFGLVLLVVLLAAGVATLWLHAQVSMARVDEALAAAAVSVSGVLQNEIDEGLALPQASADMVAELALANEGYAVVGAAGVLASRPGQQGIPSEIFLVGAGDAFQTIDAQSGRVRARRAALSYRGHAVTIVTWTSLAPVEVERRNIQRAMLLGIPLAVGLAILGGLALSRRALHPLDEMAHQAATLDEQGPVARLHGFNPRDELGTMGLAFNSLLERLDRALQQQRAFMADASHQLRTPVSVVRTTAQVTLGRTGRSNEEYREALEVVARQAERLSRLVDDMFTLALADVGGRPLQPVPLYLDELVEECVADIAAVAATKHVLVRALTQGEAPFVGDEHLLKQMLTNLLDNAVRHTPPSGAVDVNLTRSGSALRLVVADTGPGITAADAERVFERFVRLDIAANDSGGGGLGLPIARWIAHAHEGTLTVTSAGSGGAQLIVTLPLDHRPAESG